MKKIVSFLGISLIFLSSCVYLFYFYLPSLSEPEGLSLEVKSRAEAKNELGFVPLVSPTGTAFLPENSETDDLAIAQEEEQKSLQGLFDSQAEAAKKTVRKTGSSRYKGAAIPDGWQNMEPKVIELYLTEQKMRLWENGQNINEFQVSSGRRGMDTPTGLFRVKNKIDLAYSRKYRLYMPYWMAFTNYGHGIHELPVFKNGVREGANHLGRPVSHGCVRLGIGAAQQVYGWANVGTPVVIHY